MASRLSVTRQPLPVGVRLRVAGTLDGTTQAVLTDALAVAVTAGAQHVELDLSELNSCDQIGFSVLVGLFRAANSDDVTLVICGAAEPVSRMLVEARVPSNPGDC